MLSRNEIASMDRLHQAVINHAVLKMRWHPLSVQTGSDSSPSLSANAASSKGFCIFSYSGRSRQFRIPHFFSFYSMSPFSTYFFPGTGTTRVLVLDEQMTGSDTLFIAHGRRIPPTLLCQSIKVIIFAIRARVADFPVWRQFLFEK
jgi:hypothetical protein